MSDQEIRIVKLAPCRVASFFGFGQEPESAAWEALTAWAQPLGYLDDVSNHRIFGFNNPDPAPGSPNYGYEFWITIPETTNPGDQVEVKEFSGGLYAVLRCEATPQSAYEVIPAAWKWLLTWVEGQPYQVAGHQWLEEQLETQGLLTGRMILDLYLPIAE